MSVQAHMGWRSGPSTTITITSTPSTSPLLVSFSLGPRYIPSLAVGGRHGGGELSPPSLWEPAKHSAYLHDRRAVVGPFLIPVSLFFVYTVSLEHSLAWVGGYGILVWKVLVEFNSCSIDRSKLYLR